MLSLLFFYCDRIEYLEKKYCLTFCKNYTHKKTKTKTKQKSRVLSTSTTHSLIFKNKIVFQTNTSLENMRRQQQDKETQTLSDNNNNTNNNNNRNNDEGLSFFVLLL